MESTEVLAPMKASDSLDSELDLQVPAFEIVGTLDELTLSGGGVTSDEFPAPYPRCVCC